MLPIDCSRAIVAVASIVLFMERLNRHILDFATTANKQHITRRNFRHLRFLYFSHVFTLCILYLLWLIILSFAYKCFVFQYLAQLCCNLQISGPDGKNIYAGSREANGKYTFAAHSDGVYKYCFNNKMSTVTPKVVMFNMDVGDQPKDGVTKNKEGCF